MMRMTRHADAAAANSTAPHAQHQQQHHQQHHQQHQQHQQQHQQQYQWQPATAPSTAGSTPHHGPSAHGVMPPAMAELPPTMHYRVRNEVYGLVLTGRATKASAGARLVRGSMAPASALEACGNTPQPSQHLPSCRYYSFAELTAVAVSPRVSGPDMAFVEAVRAGREAGAFVMGQTQFAADPAVHRGLLAVLCPGLAMSSPTVHNNRGRTRRSHTGLLHASAPKESVAELVAASHQRAYYDVSGVWVAHTAAAARELALFELVMAHYRNGVRTGRPMSPVTVEVATSRALAEQRVM